MNQSDRQNEAAELLRQIVEQAVDDGAEMIDFERAPDGLEITAFAGANGVGCMLDDRELEDELFRWIDKNAKMGRGDRGTIEIVVHGGNHGVDSPRAEAQSAGGDRRQVQPLTKALRAARHPGDARRNRAGRSRMCQRRPRAGLSKAKPGGSTALNHSRPWNDSSIGTVMKGQLAG